MIVTIQNECLTVDIEDLGAQLASVRNHHGTEYLWQGDADIWARRAPILFPVLCGLKDNTYLLDGVPYHMNKHGFARDCVFEVVEHTDTKASFRLTDNEETRRMYPFSFTLTVTYTLEENRLIKCHRVENRSEQVMYYELGVHDGFRAPLEEGETMGQYAIRLPGLEDAIEPYGLNEQSLVTPKNGAISLENGRIALDPTTYHLDTVILDQPPQARAVLVDGQDRPRVTADFADFPYLGIWTQAKPFDTNYVCIEPWSTLPDATFVGRELKDKAGIRSLQPGTWEELSYTATFT